MFSSSTRKALKAIDHIAAAARSCVDKRRNDETEGRVDESRADLLHHLLDIVRNKSENLDFRIGEVEYEAYIPLFDGSDTTAIALRAVFYHLMKNLQAYRDLQTQIDNATSSGKLSSPPRYSEASQLPFLCATIKEAMRLHPSVGLSMPRLVPLNGIEISGMHIPQVGG
ncbi:MAG: hypothetical protein FE78DRAFT_94479 [Acidomyces sp. 'richmondensis']|nr:MAG: hypothetical protein FE78DRAFT_94479 [Acidomyces sp. 'richmondensis']